MCKREGETEDVPVDGEIRCLKCNYDLRTLPVDGQCPECGTPVVQSVQESPVLHADRMWLSRMSLALRLFFWAALSYLGVTVVVAAIFIYAKGQTQPLNTGMTAFPTLRTVMGFDALLYFLWMCCAATGVLLTAQESRLRFSEPVLCPRRLTRFGSIIVCLFAGILFIVRLCSNVVIWPNDEFIRAIPSIANLILLVFFGVYLSTLADRTQEQLLKRRHDQPLKQRTTSITRGLGISASLWILIPPITNLIGWDSDAPLSPLNNVWRVIGFVTFIYFFRYMILIADYRREFDVMAVSTGVKCQSHLDETQLECVAEIE